jgi:hypothetical protein
MTNRTMDVLRHDIADVADLEVYDGPDTDILGTQTVVTVICGEVSGELDRVVSRNEDGELVMVYEARIDGLGHGAGVAKVESDSADELMCLATVSAYLSRELAKLVGRDQTAGPAFCRVPTVDGGQLAVHSTAEGVGFVVEKSAADLTSATITEASAAQLVEAIRKALADR